MKEKVVVKDNNNLGKNAIVDGVIWKQLLIFFFPIMLGTFFQQLYTMIDAAIVGKFVGKEALAAVGGTTGTLINLLVGFFVGLSSGASVIISQYFGSKDKKGIRNSVHTAMALGLVGGILLFGVGELLAPPALKLIGTNEEVMEYALIYIRIYFLGVVPTAIYNIGAGILRAIGDSKRPLYYLIAASGINILLDVLFVVAFHWGIAGAAIATIISQVCNAIFILTYLTRTKEVYAVSLKKVKFHRLETQKMLLIGIPAGLQSSMYTVSNIIIQAGINSFGTNSIAACTVFDKLDGIFWMIMSAFGVSVTTFVGQNFGAKRFDRIKKCVRVSLAMAMITTVILCSVCVIFTNLFYRLFTNDVAVIKIGVELVRFLMPLYFTYVTIEVISGAIRGVGDAVVPVIITCLGICVFRIFWILLVLPRWHDLHVLMVSYPVTWTLTSVVFIIYYKSGGWFKRCTRKMFGEEGRI